MGYGDHSEGLSQFSGKIGNCSKNKFCLKMCVKDTDGRLEAQGVHVKMMTPGKFASISAPVMILRRCLPPSLGTIRFEDPKQMANEGVWSAATGGLSQVSLKSQTTMSFGAQNSSLGRGGN